MRDTQDNLIRMANRIGDFFQAWPDRTAGMDGIANHIEKFWEPRMRRQILAFLDAHPPGVSDSGLALHDIVREALHAHRSRLEPAPA